MAARNKMSTFIHIYYKNDNEDVYYEVYEDIEIKHLISIIEAYKVINEHYRYNYDFDVFLKHIGFDLEPMKEDSRIEYLYFII